MLRILFALCALILVAADMRAADLGPVITTTDGQTYRKAADGHYYPVAAAKRGVNVPGCDCCKPVCTCRSSTQKDPDCVCYPCQCAPRPSAAAVPTCVNGRCSFPQTVTYPQYPFAPFAAPSCSGGNCTLPTTRRGR